MPGDSSVASAGREMTAPSPSALLAVAVALAAIVAVSTLVATRAQDDGRAGLEANAREPKADDGESMSGPGSADTSTTTTAPDIGAPPEGTTGNPGSSTSTTAGPATAPGAAAPPPAAPAPAPAPPPTPTPGGPTDSCPSGSLTWTSTYTSQSSGSPAPSTWTVTVTGTITNDTSATIDLGNINGTIEYWPEADSSATHVLHLVARNTRLSRGESTAINGRVALESHKSPVLKAVTVERDWNSESHRSSCPAP